MLANSHFQRAIQIWACALARLQRANEWRDDWSGDWRPTILAVPSVDGLRDLTGKRVQINSRDRLSLWHPADEPSDPGWVGFYDNDVHGLEQFG
ncbi:MAG: hypothetical protein ACXVHJ_35195 [Solirubrobacteraceae bacterium]